MCSTKDRREQPTCIEEEQIKELNGCILSRQEALAIHIVWIRPISNNSSSLGQTLTISTWQSMI